MSITKISHHFAEYLKSKDLKNTPERNIILQESLNLEKHFEAETLVFALRSRNYKISRATVYRTLELLVDCGLFKKLQFRNNSWLYEPSLEASMHDHFKCLKCGKIIEFYDEKLSRIHETLENEFDFKIEFYSHLLYGICKNCSETESGK